MVVLILGLLVAEWLTRDRDHPLEAMTSLPRPVRWIVYTAIVWSVLYSFPSVTGPFIYFQF